MFDTQKHKFIMVQILKDIYFKSEIASFLGFKGGTAAFLFYNLPRFSVDLDFNLLDENKCDSVLKEIKKIVKKYGEVKEARKKRYTLFFLLSYGEKDKNIKIEISYRKSFNDYEIKKYLGIPMLVMKKEDMLANKLLALTGRKKMANRDLFDIWFFMSQHWLVNKSLVEKQIKMKFDSYLKECISFVEKINNTYILQGLGEVLDQKQKIWVKDNLKKEVLFLLKYYLKNK